jgi:hypothetical protein
VKKIDCLEDLGADGRIILVWVIRDIMDWMNVTVTALCEHSFELCAVYACSVTVITVDLYLQEMNTKFQCDARHRPCTLILNRDAKSHVPLAHFLSGL